MSSICRPSSPAQASARAAATYMSSPSWTCETRRSRMPVRVVIHSSLVSRKVAMSALVSTAGGRHFPQPVMAAPREYCTDMPESICARSRSGHSAGPHLECAAMTEHNFSRWRPHPWHGLEVGEDSPRIVNAYIEITPFDVIKYEID